MRNLLTISSILILIIACSQREDEFCETPYTKTNLDSIFSIGDSVLSKYYIDQAQQQLSMDSLSGELFTHRGLLNEKQLRNLQNRIIYKDSIVYVKKVKNIIKFVTDTVHRQVIITDTIRDTVRLKLFQRKRNQ